VAQSRQWLSENPSKAWAEKMVLVYTPVWIAIVGAVMLSGVYRTWGDVAYMVFGLGVAAPFVLVPLVRPGHADQDRRIWDTSWFRLNLWVSILVCFGSYFGTHYFFDVLGMRYGFQTTWNLDAEVVGSDSGEVPLFLYPLTHAFFMTYHVAMVVVLRHLSARFGLGRIARAAVVFVLAYSFAFAETFFMAIPQLEDVFVYLDRSRMLLYGSLFYACYFVVSVPMISRVDEPPEPRWPLRRVAIEALATAMIVLILLDGWALVLGKLVDA
jgi:cycloeucalenol cycloisomerase